MDDASRSPLQALVVLGCRVGPGVDLRGAIRRRVAHAADVAMRLDVPFVIASGGRRWGGVPEAEAMRLGLIEGGVPAGRVMRELRSLSTLGNAQHTAPLLRELGASRVGVVTCDWHMDRALRCFRAMGIDAEGYPAETPRRPAPYRRARALKEHARWWVSEAWLALRGFT